MVLGYTSGVFDLFHIGHLNLLNKARSQCDKLIVGVTVDELVSYKNKRAVIPFDERAQIVAALRCVDKVVPQRTMNKFEIWKELKFNIMFVGDDWKGTKQWDKYEEQFKSVGVKIVYFPYTRGTSSTLINETLLKLRQD